VSPKRSSPPLQIDPGAASAQQIGWCPPWWSGLADGRFDTFVETLGEPASRPGWRTVGRPDLYALDDPV